MVESAVAHLDEPIQADDTPAEHRQHEPAGGHSQTDSPAGVARESVMNRRRRGEASLPRYEEEARLSKLVARDTPEFVVADPSKFGEIEADRKAMAVKLSLLETK